MRLIQERDVVWVPAGEWATASLQDIRAQHEQVCDFGYVQVRYDDGHEAAAPCPVCQSERTQEQVEARIRASGIGERYFQTEWETLEMIEPLPRIKTACDRIAEIVSTGENALLYGPPGTGKTQSAVMLVKAAVRAGFTAHLENLGRLAMDIRSGYDGDGPSEATAVRELSGVDLLVLDDIGAGETGAAKVEQRILYLVTEARQNNRRPTVLTTNLSPQELAGTVGQRIINRWQPLASIPFRHGRNFRRAASGSVW